MHLEAADWEGLEWIHFTLDRNRRGVLADKILNLLFPQEEGNVLPS
jgi:hypothetical protein